MDSSGKEGFKCCLPSMFGVGAIITTMVFAYWCQSFKLRGNDITLGEGTEYETSFKVHDFHFSPWYQLDSRVNDIFFTNATDDDTSNLILNGTYEVLIYNNDNCIEWRDDDYDTKWNFTRVATIITPILGFLVTFLICTTICTGPCFPTWTGLVGKLWYCLALTYILILTTLQGLTFLFLQSNACDSDNPSLSYMYNYINQSLIDSDVLNFTLPGNATLWNTDECKFDHGGAANVAAVICWFAAGASMLCLGAPQEYSEANKDGDDDGEGEEKKESAAAEPEENEKPEAAPEEEEQDAEGGGEDKDVRQSQSLGSGNF